MRKVLVPGWITISLISPLTLRRNERTLSSGPSNVTRLDEEEALLPSIKEPSLFAMPVRAFRIVTKYCADCVRGHAVADLRTLASRRPPGRA